VNTKIRKQIERRKRRIVRRLDRDDNRGCDRPIMTAANIHYEIADRTQATAAGGIGAIHLLVRKLGLDEAINRGLGALKIHLPYHDSDHVLNIAYNLLAGGKCLEHLELRRHDAAYLDALGARRIPDPTTAGDFCRRFDAQRIYGLQQIFNTMRRKVWRQQPAAFFEEAMIDADGTMVETTGERKQGMEINYKGQWGYHPLVVSLANTGESLVGLDAAGSGALGREAPRGEAETVADGVLHVPASAGERSGPDSPHGSEDCQPPLGLESLAERLLPFVGAT
jgi:hypothetical protein